MDPAIKKKALRAFSYGMYIVTTRDGEETGAFTANWITQTSFEPPMIAIAIEADAHSLEVIRESGVFAINALSNEQRDVAGAFGKAYAKVGDKLQGRAFRNGSTGSPLLTETLAAVECRVVSEQVSGDHVLILAEVIDAHFFNEGAALTMAEAGFRYSG